MEIEACCKGLNQDSLIIRVPLDCTCCEWLTVLTVHRIIKKTGGNRTYTSPCDETIHVCLQFFLVESKKHHLQLGDIFVKGKFDFIFFRTGAGVLKSILDIEPHKDQHTLVFSAGVNILPCLFSHIPLLFESHLTDTS